MEQGYLLTDIRDGAAYLTLNDPQKMNALSRPVADALLLALERCRYAPQVRVIVLRGAGGVFCSGGDVKGMAERVSIYRQGEMPAADPRENLRNLNRLIASIRGTDKPVIAWIEGAAAGGGMSLAMACDFSLADENTKMVFAFANIALGPDTGSTVMLANRVGVPRATELMMTGKSFSGRLAADWGIITEAVKAEELEEKVHKLVRKLAAGPAGSYAAIKQAVNRVMFKGLLESMEMETEIQLRMIQNPDHWEAVDAFLEKRRPIYHKGEK